MSAPRIAVVPDTPAVRALPIRINPVAGEALDSWLGALCKELRCTWGDFVAAVGLPATGSQATPAWLVHLTPDEAAAIHAATGAPIPALHAMTLASLDGTALGLHPDDYTPHPGFPWSRYRYSRFCPRCLRDSGGRWPLFWRCGWAVACEEHGCLLVDECAVCGRRQRGHTYARSLITPGG